MRMPGHKAAILLGSVLVALLLPSVCFGFTVSLPSGTAVTMGDATATLSFTVTQDAAETKDILTVFFNIDPNLYNFSAAAQGPTCSGITWVAQPNLPDCSLPECISYTVSTGASGIAPGGSCTFDITVSGPGDGPFLSDLQDIHTDTLLGVVTSKDNGASQQKGDFTLSGTLPTWDRLALAATIAAYPLSTGVGGQIVVTMAVTNRSSAIQSAIVGNPSPPTVGGTGAATLVGVPIYSSTTYTLPSTNPTPTSLKSDIDSTMTAFKVVSTANYPISGRLLIGTELIDYTGVDAGAARFTGATRSAGGTTAAAHLRGDIVYSQNTSAFTLDIGETATIKWIYRATSAGYVYFTASARNGSGLSTSLPDTSNLVYIGDFTARVEVTPLSVISGQPVTVTMTVTNNGLTTLNDITPSLSTGGTATATLLSGPTPATVRTLSPGEIAQVEWQYTITGSLGQTYSFTGSATATGPTTTNTSTSETGEIVDYAVSVSPDVASTGAQNVTLTWTVGNNSALPVKEIQIDFSDPIAGACSSPYDWVYGSATPPANWGSATITNAAGDVTGVSFTSDPPVGTKGILPGASKDFSITFSCVDEVSADTPFNFLVTITDQSNNTASVETTVIVTAYEITLEAYDETCTTTPPPATLSADGYSRYCFKATLLKAGAPAEGEPIRFTRTDGTLSAAVGITDSLGEVWIYLTAPCSAIDVTSTVEAKYIPETTDSVDVTFSGVTSPVLRYVPNSITFHRTSPSPAVDIGSPGLSIDTGDVGYFSVDVSYCGPSAASLTIQGCPDPPGPSACDTSLATGDGSPDSFTLDSSVDITLNAGSPSATLDFLSGTISYGPIQCYPLFTVGAVDGVGAAYTGPYSSPGNTLSPDTVTVDGGTECNISVNLRILDWREVY